MKTTGYSEKQKRIANARPAPSTPYERMLWQQQHCTENITGYAVGIASFRTVRAAYLVSPGTDLTNNEREATILPKAEASALMNSLATSERWYDNLIWENAFLVPVSEDMPLTLCTFAGH